MTELHLVIETSVAQMTTEETVEIVDTIEMMTNRLEVTGNIVKTKIDPSTEIEMTKKMIETEVKMMTETEVRMMIETEVKMMNVIGIDTVMTEMMTRQVEIGETIEERDRKIEIGKFG